MLNREIISLKICSVTSHHMFVSRSVFFWFLYYRSWLLLNKSIIYWSSSRLETYLWLGRRLCWYSCDCFIELGMNACVISVLFIGPRLVFILVVLCANGSLVRVRVLLFLVKQLLSVFVLLCCLYVYVYTQCWCHCAGRLHYFDSSTFWTGLHRPRMFVEHHRWHFLVVSSVYDHKQVFVSVDYRWHTYIYQFIRCIYSNGWVPHIMCFMVRHINY